MWDILLSVVRGDYFLGACLCGTPGVKGHSGTSASPSSVTSALWACANTWKVLVRSTACTAFVTDTCGQPAEVGLAPCPQHRGTDGSDARPCAGRGARASVTGRLSQAYQLVTEGTRIMGEARRASDIYLLPCFVFMLETYRKWSGFKGSYQRCPYQKG